MPRFRKKPVVIEAEQFFIEAEQFFDDQGRRIQEWIEECGQHGKWHPAFPSEEYPEASPRPSTFTIFTMEGAMVASEGDWIIRGVKGEFYPCKPDVFEMTYDRE
jgi:hypothetical protein